MPKPLSGVIHFEEDTQDLEIIKIIPTTESDGPSPFQVLSELTKLKVGLELITKYFVNNCQVWVMLPKHQC